jgi:hypothetical protein
MSSLRESSMTGIGSAECNVLVVEPLSGEHTYIRLRRVVQLHSKLFRELIHVFDVLGRNLRHFWRYKTSAAKTSTQYTNINVCDEIPTGNLN